MIGEAAKLLGARMKRAASLSNHMKITRGNYSLEVSVGSLKAVVLPEEMASAFARGVLHYDKEIGKLLKPGKGEKADSVAWTADIQAAVEMRLETALSVVFEGVAIEGKKRERTAGKVDIGAAIAEALRAAGLDEAAVEKALVAQGHAYKAPQAAVVAVEPGVELA